MNKIAELNVLKEMLANEYLQKAAQLDALINQVVEMQKRAALDEMAKQAISNNMIAGAFEKRLGGIKDLISGDYGNKARDLINKTRSQEEKMWWKNSYSKPNSIDRWGKGTDERGNMLESFVQPLNDLSRRSRAAEPNGPVDYLGLLEKLSKNL